MQQLCQTVKGREQLGSKAGGWLEETKEMKEGNDKRKGGEWCEWKKYDDGWKEAAAGLCWGCWRQSVSP